MAMERPDHLLEAAAKRFALYGFRRTVLDDVARDAGMAKGSIYLHAASKEDLFLQVVQREQQLMGEAAREAAAGHEDPRRAMEAIVWRMLPWLDERPLMGRLMTGDPELGTGPELAGRVAETCHSERHVYAVIGEEVNRGVATGLFRPDTLPKGAVTLVISLFHIHLHNKRQRFIELDSTVFIRELLRILFEGIQKREGEPA